LCPTARIRWLRYTWEIASAATQLDPLIIETTNSTGFLARWYNAASPASTHPAAAPPPLAIAAGNGEFAQPDFAGFRKLSNGTSC
jgi:hypothetical protein